MVAQIHCTSTKESSTIDPVNASGISMSRRHSSPDGVIKVNIVKDMEIGETFVPRTNWRLLGAEDLMCIY